MKKIMICCLLFLFFSPISVFAADGYDVVTLSNCADADSARFMLDKVEVKVKFMGIDSSTIIYDNFNDEIDGSLVKDYVCSILTNAKEIKIEYEPNIDKEDKYGRINAWVFIDGVLLQKHLVELGYSKVAYLYDDYKYGNELKSAEKVAKENKVGIWMDKESDEVIVNNVVDSDEKDTKEEENVFSRIICFLSDLFEKLLKLIDDFINDVL